MHHVFMLQLKHIILLEILDCSVENDLRIQQKCQSGRVLITKDLRWFNIYMNDGSKEKQFLS